MNERFDGEFDNATTLVSRLEASEIRWWAQQIQAFRTRNIQDSAVYVSAAIKTMGLSAESLKDDIDLAIDQIRETAYNCYLKDEARFHLEMARFLSETREVPRRIIRESLEPLLESNTYTSLSPGELSDRMSNVAGEYVGRIFPYLYQLSLSTTQSRRSRAGTEFELIIEMLLNLLGIPNQAQGSIGSAMFEEVNLGKSVDILVPSVDGYKRDPQECAVITVKTTLRERWTQVAEELQRTNIPRIYLVTLDRDISKNVVELMKRYKITLVVPNSVKNERFTEDLQVHSYQDFFTRDIPHVVSYWI